jgi:hypothetical protein
VALLLVERILPQEEELRVETGQLFRTGQEAPVSGVYRFIESADAGCEPTPEAMEIPLSRGERFPPHRRCKGAVIWEFVRRA